MKKRTAWLLCLAILAGLLAGCSGDGTIIGTWKAEADISAYLGETLGAAASDLVSFVSFQDVKLTLLVTFRKDGTYSFSGDEKATSATVEAIKTQMTEGVTQYLQKVILDAGLNLSVEELLSMQGMSLESLIDTTFSQEMVASILEGMAVDGTYEIQEDKLYLDGTECTFQLRGKWLTLDGEGISTLDRLLPLEFKRQ